MRTATLETRIERPPGADLRDWIAHDWSAGIQLDATYDGMSLVVETVNNTYEVTVMSGGTGEVRVRGGEFFPRFTPARLTGSSLGGSFLKMGGIYVGFRLELRQQDGRVILTSPVQSIGYVVHG